ncbi:MAG TPA: serine hydrolase domain-containing protein [Steroidobacteraceae bacterium]|nr:serine hydrolase domain-containing protein [Steroidobacteraceae bacterium]
MNIKLPRASARTKIALLPAAAALLLTVAMALFAMGIAWSAPPSAKAAAQSAPTATPAPAAPPAATAPAAPASPLTAADLDVWLDGYLPYALKTGDIAGAVIAVVKDGAVVTERGYGFSDVGKRTPVDPQLTLFRPGSVSKLITWTAVMQLVEQGKIDLDADINKYLDFTVTGLGGKPITVRNLMQHTAGFEEHARGVISAKDDVGSFETLLKQAVPARIFAPGSTPAYSNYGCSLAGYIVERVSGEPFDVYLEKHSFEPLDMQHSSFRQPLPKELAPLMSKGYRTASGEAEPFEYVGPRPAGSMSSTGDDMAHFMIAHLQDGEYHGNRILGAATAELMHNSPYGDPIGPLNRMELGFFETNINGREVIAHLGDTEWFHTSLHLFLKENTGLYASFNSPGKEGAVQTLRTELFQDFADRYFPAAVPHPVTAQVDAKTQAAHAALMSGAWQVSRRADSNFLAALGLIGETKVGANKNGELQLPFPGPNGKPRHWVEIAPFVWQDVAGHDRAAAKVVDGRPVRFSFDFLSPFMVFDRAPWYASSLWLTPLVCASLAALLLTALVWPVAAIVRRRYQAPLALEPKALRAYLWSRIGALAIVAALGVWGLFMVLILNDTGTLGGRLDPLLLLAQLLGIVAFLGGIGVMLWNLLAVWRGAGRRWPAKLWSVVLVVAAVAVLWVGLVAKLMSVGTNY